MGGTLCSGKESGCCSSCFNKENLTHRHHNVEAASEVSTVHNSLEADSAQVFRSEARDSEREVTAKRYDTAEAANPVPQQAAAPKETAVARPPLVLEPATATQPPPSAVEPAPPATGSATLAPVPDPTASAGTGSRSMGLGRTPSGNMKRRVSQKAAVGKPFPSRPIGCKLSSQAWAKVEELFNAMDADHTNAVTREQASNFFKGAFAQLSVTAMFNEVDVDGSGAITAEEFVDFWVQVRKAGYSDEDIIEELIELREGNAWVDWKDDRATANAVSKTKRFPKRPIFCKLSSKSWKKCEALFRKMDADNTMGISIDNAEAFFKGAFSKVSARAMFNEVDVNNHGTITAEQFMNFWVQVKASGYKDKDIQSELDQLLDGGAWVDWKDGRSTS
mmetsp:Transcript_64031/g.152705  ORF Transcript_64031/g.152705 Transcript_64031/m.152705 type:complete len:391 (+) Transcript_64031:111-1283(+)|eukprot:CAMPEP_0178411106 /NCGR_PEP_ID=MMETSP0689_2-20121128/21325_1 /TAXON_ID=160604 /ORGANISM="Amphidinium massartii, Strain CS-259" /LENGTH=390 /DNA_ID=CAMNT_0020032305 /DNA_START=99 /DNA_END=1271 /DNA_ORIENTATION=-